MANISAKESTVCPICCDKFFSPKLLPCCHTFCKPCIRRLLYNSTPFGAVVCPQCQKETRLDEEGLDALFDNFFVPLRTEERPIDIFYCGCCMKMAALRHCAHCSELLCTDCRSSHLLATTLSGEPWNGNSSNDDGKIVDIPKDHLPEENQLSINPHPQKIQLNASLKFSVTVESLYSSLDIPNTNVFSVRSIRQTENNTYLVLLYLGPEVVEFSSTGKEINRYILEEGVTSDIIYLPGGNIYYSSLQNGLIMKMDSRNNRDVFAQTVQYQPFSLSFFRDGRIVAGGPSYQRSVVNGHGAILIYDRHGHLKREIVQSVNGMFVKFPISISVSDCDTICVADKEYKSVFLFSDTGALLSFYDGKFDIEPRDICPLFPTALCHDSEGNLIVANALDGAMHVLAPKGDFKGYLITKNSEGFQRPSALCMDERKRICVGDMENRTLRFYEISSFRNFLETHL